SYLFWHEPVGHHPELPLERDVALENRDVLAAREQEQIAALVQPYRLTGLILETLQHLDAFDGQADVDLAAELVTNAAGALAGRALAEQVRPLEQQHAGLAAAGEMVGGAHA